MSDALTGRGLLGSPQGRVGSIIDGKWQIDARLGSGGMATVYSATHRNGNRVALKMLHPQLSRVEDVRTRFLREGYVANAVAHPGVVTVLDDGETEDGAVFLVLELLEGETIDARRERLGGALPIEEALDVADAALDALAAAHEKGVVHRDVKPENVFITKDGRVKLLDFGLARMKDLQVEETKTGITIGTPEFMPPEQASGRRDAVDARSDVWGLGATIFTAITGRFVHDAQTLHEQLIAAATRRPRPIRTVAPHVPAAVAAVIDRALELEMSDRWQSARDMQTALRAARGRGVVRPSSDQHRVASPTGGRRQSSDNYRSLDVTGGRRPSSDQNRAIDVPPSSVGRPPSSAAWVPPRIDQGEDDLGYEATQAVSLAHADFSIPSSGANNPTSTLRLGQPTTEPFPRVPGTPDHSRAPFPPPQHSLQPQAPPYPSSSRSREVPVFEITARRTRPSLSIQVITVIGFVLFALCAALGAYVYWRGTTRR